MSAVEITLYVLLGIGVAIYIGCGIYDLKHPEKVKERKLKKKQKKEQKKNKNKVEEGEYF